MIFFFGEGFFFLVVETALVVPVAFFPISFDSLDLSLEDLFLWKIFFLEASSKRLNSWGSVFLIGFFLNFFISSFTFLLTMRFCLSRFLS